MSNEPAQVQFSLRLPRSLRVELDRAAALEDQSTGALVKRILTEWVAKQEERPSA